MSANRGDCEHGHGAAVLALAETVATDHETTARSAALVFQDHEGEEAPTIVGRFNTAALGSMAMAMLAKCAEHEPDGCAMCDSMAAAAKLAAEVFAQEFKKLAAERAN